MPASRRPPVPSSAVSLASRTARAGAPRLVGRPILVLIVALLALSGASGAMAQDAPAPGRITAVGEGRTTAAPDMATLALGVVREAPTAAAALDDASVAMRDVLAAMADEGIAARDLRTTDVSLSPVYENVNEGPGRERPGIAAYRARLGLSVRVRDFDAIGAVLDRAVSLGVNEGGQLAFGNSDAGALRAEARAAAVRDARERAGAMAEAAGVGLGRLVSLREAEGFAAPAPFEARMAVAEAVPIAGGESEIVARVEAVFEIGVPVVAEDDAGGNAGKDEPAR